MQDTACSLGESPGFLSLMSDASSLADLAVPDTGALKFDDFMTAPAPTSSPEPGLVPDGSFHAPAAAGFEDMDSMIRALELDMTPVKPKVAAPPPRPTPYTFGGVVVPPPPPVPKRKAASRARHQRPRGPATNGADVDNIARYFPRDVLRLEPDEYARVKAQRIEFLTTEEQRKLTSLRRRARNCVYAEIKRQERIAAKRDADSANSQLLEENRQLREENMRLQMQLAVFAADQAKAE